MTSQAATNVKSRTRKAKTWSSFGNLGRKPSEYEVVTHDMNHTAKEIPLEMSISVTGNEWLTKYRDSIRLNVIGLSDFRDPDQMTYRKYCQVMDQQETYVDGLIQQYCGVSDTDAKLTANTVDYLSKAFAPSRYLAHGMQMLGAYIQQLARSSYVGNCAVFQASDELRYVQRVAYRTKQLGLSFPEKNFGKQERAVWEGHADWQPLRRAIEKLLITYEWDRAFAGLNLVVKPLADELLLKVFADQARELGDELDALIAENLYQDSQRSRRWTVEVCSRMIALDPANKDVLLQLVRSYETEVDEIIHSLSRLLTASGGAKSAVDIAQEVKAEWTKFLISTGVFTAV